MKRLTFAATALLLMFATAPMARADGKLLRHLSFDNQTNPLKVEGGADAVVRRNRDEKVSGMGEVKWEANGGDGAVAIPIGWHIAVPIPEELTKEPGNPFSVEMKVKFSKFERNTYPSLLNMPADNASPGMLYLVTDSQYVDPVICVKQWDKSWGAGEKGKSGFTAEKWETVLAVFDREKTEVFLNGDKIISCKGKLAGSYADCSKAGGYILLSADPSPSGGTIHWADLKIYAGAIGGTPSTPGGSATSTNGGDTSTQGGGVSGNWLCRITFNDKANPLKAEGVADAIVRKGQTEPVSGMGEVKWLSEGGDGAVAIPKNYHIALPVPNALTKTPGLPWTIKMRFKLDSLSDDGVLLNMPADNSGGCLLYVHTGDARIAVKQHVKSSGSAIHGDSGFVVGKIHTLQMCFGENKTTAFLDGRQIFTHNGTLAGSYADCAKAGGYFLIRGDDNGDGDTVTFYDVEVYDGVVGAATPAGTAESAEKKDPPLNTSGSSASTPTGTTVRYGTQPNQVMLENGAVLNGEYKDTTFIIPAGATVTLEGLILTNSGGTGSAIECLGNATIVLSDKSSLSKILNHADEGSGIHWPAGCTLVIRGYGDYGRERLEVTSTKPHCAGIGAYSKDRGDGKGKCGNVVFEGGWTTANGGVLAAGVGAADWGASCGNITIRGNACVTANGGPGAAAIGAGARGGDCGDILIDGDKVIVEARRNVKETKGGAADNGAGIGAGHDTRCGNITIRRAGRVEAYGHDARYGGAGIGAGGYDASTGKASSCGDIIIEGGLVQAYGRGEAAGIGASSCGNCGSIVIKGVGSKGSTVNAFGSPGAAGIGVRGAGKTITITGGGVFAKAGAAVGSGSAAKSSPAIGSCWDNAECGTITITGGITDAYGAPGSPGIGAARHGKCGNITIGDGIVQVSSYKGEGSPEYLGKSASGTSGTISIPKTIKKKVHEKDSRLMLYPRDPEAVKKEAEAETKKNGNSGGANNGGGGTAPSDEVKQTLDTFSADDGLSAAEKIPALKAYIETHLDEPGIEKLIDLLEKLAKDANDAETLKWVEEIRKKLADRESGGGKDGKTGLDVLTDTENVDPGKKNVDEKKDKTDGEEIDDEGATKDEIVAAAEAAMKDLSVFAPSDEKIAAIDAAFKKMPKIRRTKPESSRKPIEPVMSDAFFDSLPPRQLIAHFRELMRDILGPMTPDTEKRFEKEFAAAISYPTDEVVEWVRKAAPIISEIQRLKAGMMQEFVDFDSTFGDACIAQNFDYYDGAYNRISDASRTVCSMEAIKARMEELFKMYLALGPMPNAAEQQKQDAAEYKAAGKAVKDYIIIGGEVTDAIKDIEGVYHVDPCAFTLTVSNDSKEPENSGRLTDSPADNHTHAPWRMEKLYIKPITQFGGEDGLVYVYIYGEDPPDSDGEAKYDSRVLEAWAVPDGEGGLLFFGGGDNLIAMKKELRDAFLSNKDEKGNDITDMDVRKEYLHPECIHLKPAKDDDGRDILILKHHWLHDDGNWKPVSPGSSEYHKVYRDKTYTYATMVFRPSPAEDYQTLPEAHEDCTAAWTKGNTVEEKALEAARLYPEALKRFEKEREQYTKKAASFGDTYATLPTIYELYFVISGAPEISLGSDYDKTNPLEGKAPVAIYGDKITGTDDVYLNMAKQRPEVQPPPDYKDQWGVWANMACEEYLGRLDLFGFSHSKKWDISICGGQSWSNDTPPEKKAKVDSASVDLKANWTCPFPTVVRAIDGTGPLAFDLAVESKKSQYDRNIPDAVTGYKLFYRWNEQPTVTTNYLEIASASGDSGKIKAKFEITETHDEDLHVDGTNRLYFALFRSIGDVKTEDGETKPWLYRSDEVYSAQCDYKLMYMNAEQAEELAAKLGESLSEILTPPEEDSDIREELMQKVKDAKEAQEAKEANIEFHKANIEFLDKRMASLKEEISKEKDPARKDALQFQIICAESDKLYEQDRIRAEQTGVWRPTRTPFDEMCITQVRESAMREIAEINAANRARKRAEAIADKLPTKAQQDKAYEMINKIVSKDGNDYESLVKLGDIMRDQYQNYLDYDRHMDAAEDAYWSKKLQYAENTKLACDVALSLCGGAGGYAKAIEASYVCITSYKEGGFTNAFKKTVCTIWDCVDVASEVIDGIVEDGWKGALKKGEISFAMHYGIPYLLGKMKGPPDGTGCYNSFDVDRLNKWHPAPRLATRKPPRVADVNAAFFEKNYATQKISQYIEKKNAFNAIKDFTKNDPDAIIKARRAYFKAAGEVNSNPMAKAILKYDPQYKRLGISKSFALDIDDINDIATTRTLNTMVEKGYSRQELVSFRNKSSIGSVGMDADFGLKEYKDMQITLNNKPITKHQWAEATQKQLNSDYFDLTGQSAEKSFVNVTYSGDKEAYKNLAVLKASKDPKAMRHIIQSSSLSDVQQMMDVTKYKANVMLDIKGHPKLVGKYEAIRGTGKDLETKIVPAIKGEIDALKEEAKKLAKVGKALPKAQEVKLEKLQAAHSRYKKVELACKRVGELKVPLYEADDYVRTATGGKSIPELLDDIDTMLQSLNLLRPKK